MNQCHEGVVPKLLAAVESRTVDSELNLINYDLNFDSCFFCFSYVIAGRS